MKSQRYCILLYLVLFTHLKRSFLLHSRVHADYVHDEMTFSWSFTVMSWDSGKRFWRHFLFSSFLFRKPPAFDVKLLKWSKTESYQNFWVIWCWRSAIAQFPSSIWSCFCFFHLFIFRFHFAFWSEINWKHIYCKQTTQKPLLFTFMGLWRHRFRFMLGWT